jgi:NAD(P)-dependent dehydrogenase (short-subunit alcohol dehydrogenase family)
MVIGAGAAPRAESPPSKEPVVRDPSPPRTAVVTGAGSGIGAAIAHALASAGWTVAHADRRPDALASVAERGSTLPGTLEPMPTDVTYEASVRRLFDQVVERHGRVDLLFNNAGTGGPSSELDEIPLRSGTQ